MSASDSEEIPEVDAEVEVEAKPAASENEKIKLFVIFGERSLVFNLKMNHRMDKLFRAAERAFQMEPNTLKFMYHGDRLQPENTPLEMEMEDQEEVSAFVEQLGGAMWPESCS